MLFSEGQNLAMIRLVVMRRGLLRKLLGKVTGSPPNHDHQKRPGRALWLSPIEYAVRASSMAGNDEGGKHC